MNKLGLKPFFSIYLVCLETWILSPVSAFDSNIAFIKWNPKQTCLPGLDVVSAASDVFGVYGVVVFVVAVVVVVVVVKYTFVLCVYYFWKGLTPIFEFLNFKLFLSHFPKSSHPKIYSNTLAWRCFSFNGASVMWNQWYLQLFLIRYMYVCINKLS